MIEFLLNFALALEELVHIFVGHFLSKFGVDLFKFLQKIDGLLYRFLHDLADCTGVVEQWLLLEIADGIAGRQNGLAVDLLVHASHGLHAR